MKHFHVALWMFRKMAGFASLGCAITSITMILLGDITKDRSVAIDFTTAISVFFLSLAILFMPIFNK